MFNQKGFSKVAIIIIVLILLGGVYFVFGKKDKNIPAQSAENKSSQSSQSSDGDLSVNNWKTYRNDQYGFEVKYPSKNYKLVDKSKDVSDTGIVSEALLEIYAEPIHYEGNSLFGISHRAPINQGKIYSNTREFINDTIGKDKRLLEVENIKDVSLGVIDGIKIEWKESYDGEAISKISETYVIKGGILYNIYYNNNQFYPESELAKIADSFKFTR